MQIVAPELRYHRSFLAAWDEFAALDEDPANWTGAFGLTREQVATPEGFAALCDDLLRSREVAPEGFVRVTMLWAVEGDEWLGRVSVRHELNDFLRREGGHIGYAVRPSARRRGIAGALMRAGVAALADLGVADALLTCDDDNVGSYRVIEAAGGVLEGVVDGTRRYWVATGASGLVPIEPEDAAAIVGWVGSQADVTLFAGPGLAFPLTADAFLATASDSWRILVLREAGRPVATGSLGSKGQGTARIGRMLVDPARRGEGLGRRVMVALLAEAARLPGVTTVTLGVYEQNTGARALYEALGFTDTGERHYTDVDGEPWVALQLARPVRMGR